MPELWDTPVTYGAIGATQAPDLLRFPPAGYRPLERKARIGHGDARFDYACASAMSWGIQRGSGFRVRTINSPETSSESTFGPDGTAFVRPGDTAELFIPVLGPIGVKAPARVVYVVDEAKRKGFAYGTLPGHPEDGEEAFIVSQNLDGSVWLTVRAFSRPSSRWWWAVYPALRLAQELYTRRYLRALAKPFD
jgi:uncharacterized protein (UPF0548 family)